MQKIKKIKKIIVTESIILVFSLMVILFEIYTHNIFFPDYRIMILLYVIGATYLALGIWYDKL